MQTTTGFTQTVGPVDGKDVCYQIWQLCLTFGCGPTSITQALPVDQFSVLRVTDQDNKIIS